MKKLFIFPTLLILCFTALFFASCTKGCSHEYLTDTVIEPTCDQEGKTIHKCTVCSYEYISDLKAPLGHSLEEEVTEPTCTEMGYTLYTCDRCDYSYRSDFLAPTEHDFIQTRHEVTCTEAGNTLYRCSVCDFSFTADFTAPTGHTFLNTTVPVTCTHPGYTIHTCSCGYQYNGEHIFYTDILENAYVSTSKVYAKGIDVSRYNHKLSSANVYLPLDWNAIKAAGYQFVILKAGSTKSGKEPTFEMDYQGAKAAGLDVGVYFYTYSATPEATRKDADLLLSWLSGKKLEYPVYFDLEDSTLSSVAKNDLSTLCVTFIERLQECGYYCGLYSNNQWLNNILDTPKMTTLFDIWYARYPGTASPTWDTEKYGKQLGMWQFTQTGTISGFSCNFDMNYAYRDYPEIMRKWHLNGY